MYVCRNPLELFYFWWLFRMVGEIPPLWIRIHCGIESSTRHLFTLQIYTGNLYTFCNSSAIKWLSTIVKGCPNDNDPLLMENICLPVIFWGMKSIHTTYRRRFAGKTFTADWLLLSFCKPLLNFKPSIFKRPAFGGGGYCLQVFFKYVMYRWETEAVGLSCKNDMSWA